MSNKIEIYTTVSCPFCFKAKELLDSLNLSYKEISVENDVSLREEMAKKAGKNTVPQIWINDFHIGGCDDLYKSYDEKKLESILISN